ncbi:MAG: class I SAM-dependent methyltransferase [Verrucomicrobia bacterium]|nr:class I SAM-dependent methyltransferase [Verrucomicrobiota bacterium]MBS0646675.1 class I SAM-dependent methyltransferase [Verrucomicrobiota bacterium]
MTCEKTSTVEPQYVACLDIDEKYGRTELGLMSNQVWHDDPRRLLFVLARYKFVSKMLKGCQSALEIGCADAFGTRIIRQEVPYVLATDFDPVFIQDCLRREAISPWPISFLVHDILSGPVKHVPFEAAFSLDVLEHIHPSSEDAFIRNICDSLLPQGHLIVGSPSKESQEYASVISKQGHINCKTAEDMYRLFKKYFHNVLLFSMNDEMVHTGFSQLAHYLFVVCSGKKSH